MMTDLERFIYLPYMMTFRNISWHNYNCGGSRGFNPPPPPPPRFFFCLSIWKLQQTCLFGDPESVGFGGFVSPALAKAKLGCSRHCHKSVCMYVCPAVHEVLFLRNYSTKSFQNWQADALGHPDVPFSKWSWSDWHCGHKSQIVKRMCG